MAWTSRNGTPPKMPLPRQSSPGRGGRATAARPPGRTADAAASGLAARQRLLMMTTTTTPPPPPPPPPPPLLPLQPGAGRGGARGQQQRRRQQQQQQHQQHRAAVGCRMLPGAREPATQGEPAPKIWTSWTTPAVALAAVAAARRTKPWQKESPSLRPSCPREVRDVAVLLLCRRSVGRKSVCVGRRSKGERADTQTSSAEACQLVGTGRLPPRALLVISCVPRVTYVCLCAQVQVRVSPQRRSSSPSTAASRASSSETNGVAGAAAAEGRVAPALRRTMRTGAAGVVT